MKCIEAKELVVILFEPVLYAPDFFHLRLIKDLAAFKAESDLILTDRHATKLDDEVDKVYTRNLYGGDA